MNQPTAHCANRTVHDADSHITESGGWMEKYASKYVTDNLDKPFIDLEAIPQLKPVFEQAKKRLAGNDPAWCLHRALHAPKILRSSTAAAKR